MPELIEKTDRMEIHSIMGWGLRAAFALLALFPLMASYELWVVLLQKLPGFLRMLLLVGLACLDVGLQLQ